FVYECMQENDYTLGGEQSGHIILKKYATTGDGLLTAIMICEEVCSRKKKLSELSEPVMVYPQYTKNIKVSDKAKTLSDSNVLKAKEDVEKLIDGKGRVLLRESGTEPVIRIMIECEEGDKCQEYAEIIADKVKEGGYAV
ncbi:MAG: phosphoglucosamine mutase, partial [Ruminococcaceae bacterium]|nr:phosphoglucosamine mutase [Oscillospiraceae bacterium]